MKRRYWIPLAKADGMLVYQCPVCRNMKKIMHDSQWNPIRCRICGKTSYHEGKIRRYRRK